MDPIHVVRHDHATLRKKLTLIESALQVSSDAPYVLREQCMSLQQLLVDHLSREMDVLQRYGQLTATAYEPVEVEDHGYTYHLLRTVNELLLTDLRTAMPTVSLWLSKVIELLRLQMDEQERLAFAVLDTADQALRAQGSSASISGAMSVNEILHRFPETERCFTPWHVNRLQEGYESVDEFAWHHGMDVSQFIEQLRQAATARQFDAEGFSS